MMQKQWRRHPRKEEYNTAKTLKKRGHNKPVNVIKHIEKKQQDENIIGMTF
jgi:hypothetical protein